MKINSQPFRGVYRKLGSSQELALNEAMRLIREDETISFQGHDQDIALPVNGNHDYMEAMALGGLHSNRVLKDQDLIPPLTDLRELGATFTAKMGGKEIKVGAYGALNILSGDLDLPGLRVAFSQGGPSAALAGPEALAPLFKQLTPTALESDIQSAPPELERLHRYVYTKASQLTPGVSQAQDLARLAPASAFLTDNRLVRDKETQAKLIDSFFKPHLEKSELGRAILDYCQEKSASKRNLHRDLMLYQTSLEPGLSNDMFVAKATGSLSNIGQAKSLRLDLLSRIKTNSLSHVDQILDRLPSDADRKKAKIDLVHFAQNNPEMSDTKSLAHGLSDFAAEQFRRSQRQIVSRKLKSVLQAGLKTLSPSSKKASLVENLLANKARAHSAIRARHEFLAYKMGLEEGAPDQKFISKLLSACKPLDVNNLASRVGHALKPELYHEVREFTKDIQLDKRQATREALLLKALKKPEITDLNEVARHILKGDKQSPELDQVGLYRLLAQNDSGRPEIAARLVEFASEFPAEVVNPKRDPHIRRDLLKLSDDETVNLEKLQSYFSELPRSEQAAKRKLESFLKDRPVQPLVKSITQRLREVDRPAWGAVLSQLSAQLDHGADQSELLEALKERLIAPNNDEKVPLELGLVLLENEPQENFAARAAQAYLLDEFGIIDREPILATRLIKSGLVAASPSLMLERSLEFVEAEERPQFLQAMAEVLLADPKLEVDPTVYEQIQAHELEESDLLWLIRGEGKAESQSDSKDDEIRVEDEFIFIGDEALEIDL